jgi:hypothetical protein
MHQRTRFFTDVDGVKSTFKTFLLTFESNIVMPFGEYVKEVYGALSDTASLVFLY